MQEVAIALGRILVVDDELDVRKSIGFILAKAGFDVIEAEDGEKAITAIRSDDNPLMVDTIICDLSIPKVNGIETILYFRAQFPSVPVIVLTGKPYLQTAVAMFKQGVVDYLIKPVEPEKLTASVRQAVELHKHFNDKFVVRAEIEEKAMLNEQTATQNALPSLERRRHCRRLEDAKLLQRQRELEAARCISLALFQRINVNELMEQVLRTALEVIGAEAGSILLADPVRRQLIFLYVIGSKAEVLHGAAIPWDKGLAGAVFHSGKPVVCSDIGQDPRHFSLLDLLTDYKTTDMIVLPLKRWDGNPIGVLEVLNKRMRGGLHGKTAVYVISTTMLVGTIAALAVLDAERDAPNATITNFGDAVWWALSTITTVGYGDMYPITTEGRIVAGTLMVGGIALLGVITASFASWFVGSVRDLEDEVEESGDEVSERLDQMLIEIRRLSARVQSLEARLTSGNQDEQVSPGSGR